MAFALFRLIIIIIIIIFIILSLFLWNEGFFKDLWLKPFETSWDVSAIYNMFLDVQEKFEDTKAVIRNSKLNKVRPYNGKKDKQWSTKHYTEN